MLSLHILSPGRQSKSYPTKHFAILAWVQEVISTCFLHIQIVLLSISPLEETQAQTLVSRGTDGTDKSPINTCADKFLSVGTDPRKYSPGDVITLSKPLITLPCEPFCVLEIQPQTLKPALGLSSVKSTHTSVAVRGTYVWFPDSLFLAPLYTMSICHGESFERAELRQGFHLESGDLCAHREGCAESPSSLLTHRGS